MMVKDRSLHGQLSGLLLIVCFIVLISIIVPGQGKGEDIDCTLVSGFGGLYSDVVYDNSYAYTANQRGITIFDVSDPSDPEFVGQYITPDQARGVAVSGNYLYVADYKNGLLILDVSTKSAPVLEGHYTTTGRAMNVDVIDNYAYLADYSNGLEIVDVTDEDDPQQVGNFDTAQSGGDDFYAYDVDIQGDYAYIAADRRFYIVDVSVKAAPMEESRLSVDYSEHITVSGNYAYLDDYDGGQDDTDLLIIDVTDKENPEKVTIYDTPGGASGVAILNDHAYIADWHGLYVVDVTDKENPDLISDCDTGGNSIDLVYYDDHVYMADGYNGLSIVDVSTITDPVKVGGFGSIADTHEITISGDYAYVADFSNGLVIADISDMNNPTYAGKYQNESRVRGVAVLGDYAYLAYESEDLIVIDISDKSKPTFVTKCEISSQAYSISASGDYVYVGNNAGYFFVYNVTQRDDPVLEGETTLSSSAKNIFIYGEYAYTSGYSGGFDIIDILDKTEPEVVGEYDSENEGYGVAASGNYAYIVDGTYLTIVDISDKTDPQYEIQYDTPGYPRDLDISGNLIFMADGGGGLSVIDVSDPGNPELACQYDTTGNYDTVTTEGNTAFISDDDYGMYILRVTRDVWIESISPSPALDDDEIEFIGGVFDESEVQKYVWTSSIDGEIYNGVDKEFSHDGLSNGTHTISFKVQYNSGSWSNEAVTSLFINGIPVAHIDSISPNPALSRQRIYFNAIGTDDGSITRYVWRSSNDGDLYDGGSDEFSSYELTNGTHTIFLKVLDDQDEWSEETSKNLEINGKPAAHIDSISPNPEIAEKPVTFNGHGTDDGSIEEYQWRSSKDDVIYLGVENEFTSSDLTVGKHTIYLTVRDDDGAWSSEDSELIEILRNYPATLYVGGSGEGNYTTINEALDDCFDGDTIMVLAGTYNETIIIEKSIDLLGEGNNETIISGDEKDSVIQITADDVKISGFRIINSKRSPSRGGVVIKSDGCRIHHNAFDANYYGVYLYQGRDTIIENNVISHSYNAVYILQSVGPTIIQQNICSDSWENGLVIQNSWNCTVTNNSVSDNRYSAIYLTYADNNSISNNRCSRSGYSGISLRDGCDHNVITGNTLEGNDNSDLRIDKTTYSTLTDNAMDGKGFVINGFEREYWTTHTIDSTNTLNGIPVAFYQDQHSVTVPSNTPQVFLVNCTNVLIDGLNCSNTAMGIVLAYSSWNTIQNCVFSGNSWYGILVMKSENNTILDSIVSHCEYSGIIVSSSHKNTLDNISFKFNQYGYGSSLDIVSSNDNTITNSSFEENYYAIRLRGSLFNRLEHNWISGNQQGIYLHYTSRNNSARYNSIMNNTDYGIYCSSSYDHIDATYCWWGNPSGPYHSTWNQNGTGDNITNYVEFDPWHVPPNAHSISVSKDMITEGEEIIFSGDASGYADISYYIWISDQDGEFIRSDSNRTHYSGLSIGTHTITFFALDALGFYSDEIHTSIIVNGKPTASITSVTPSPSLLSSPVYFMGSATDDGSITRYSWSSSIDGEFYNGIEAEFTYSQLSTGTHTITLRTQDDLGAWSAEVTQILIIHTKPTASITSITPSPAILSHTIHFMGSGTDDGTITRYVWSSSLDGEFYNGTDPEFDHSSLQKGLHTLTLKVQDNNGIWSDEVTTTLEISEKEGGGNGEDEDSFLFRKIGPLPIIAYVVIIVIVLGGAGTVLRKKKLQGDQSISTPPAHPASPSQAPAQATPPPSWTCPKCNQLVGNQYSFCLQCGTKRSN